MRRVGYFFCIACLSVSHRVAADSVPERFDTPEAAVHALAEAVKTEDRSALNRIFGADFLAQIRSGDPVADGNRIHALADKLGEERRIVEGRYGQRILEVGPSHWPFPAPLTQRDGTWAFNSVLGAQEIVHRRIGENEIRAIRVSQYYVDAQRLYHAKDRTGRGETYAIKFISSLGKRDGLYWPESEQGPSPFGPLIGRAVSEGYTRYGGSGDGVYQGYHYRILTKQGAHAPGGTKNYVTSRGMTDGFALLAYPARWGVAGIMSFMVSNDGVVYQKNLGSTTLQQAAAIHRFDPDPSWSPVPEE